MDSEKQTEESSTLVQPPPVSTDSTDNSDMRKKFLLLKQKMNKLRDSNVQEVVKEDLVKSGTFRKRKKKKRGKKRKRKYDMNVTAEETEFHKKKRRRKEKNSGPSGWGIYSDEHKYRVYLKRCKDLPSKMVTEEKEKKKKRKKKSPPSKEGEEEEETSSEEEEEVDETPFQEEVDEEGKERLVQHLSSVHEKRKKFNRRRTFLENQKINYINERNRKYNRKIEQAYGKFTSDLRKAINDVQSF